MNIPKVPIGEILNIDDRIYLGTINGNVDITQKKDYFFVVGTKNEIINLTPEDRNTKNLYFSLNDCFVYSFVGGIEDVNITPIVMNVNCFEQDTQEAKFWYNITEGSLKYRNNNHEIIDLNAVILSVHDHTNLSDIEKVSGLNTGDETRNSIIEKIGFEVSPEEHTHTDILGNAVTADKLKVPIAINGIAFDGSEDIVIKPSNIIWNYLFRTMTDSERDYWNNKQGKDTNLSAILALEETNGILRKHSFGSWSLDNSEYALISEVMKTTGDQSVSGIKTFNNDIYINGNIYQQGAAYETHAEKIYTKNDFITLREGAISGLNTGYTGLIAKLYDGVNDGQLVFDSNGTARVGDVGFTQAIATREDNPVNNKVAVWSSENMRFETANSPTTIAGYGITDAVDTSTNQIIKGNKTFNNTLTAYGSIVSSYGLVNVDFRVGTGSSSITGYKTNIYANAGVASVSKWSNSVTGQTATDGLDFGITADGTAEIRQRENMSLNEYTNNTLRRTVTGEGFHIFNGSPAPRTYVLGTVIPKVQIEGTDLPNSSLAITRNSADTSASCLFLGKSRGTTYNSFTKVSDGDFLSAIYFTGADGTQMINAGSISARVNGTPSAGNIPIDVSITIGSIAVVTAKADGSIVMSGSVNIPTGKNYNINGVNLKDVSETLTNKTLTSPIINTNATGTAITTTGEVDKLVKTDSSGDVVLSRGKDLFFGSKSTINVGAGVYGRVGVINTQGLTTVPHIIFGTTGNDDKGYISFVNNGAERFRTDYNGINTFTSLASTAYNAIFRNTSYATTDTSGTSSIKIGYSNHDGVKIEAYKDTAFNISGIKFYGEYGIGTEKLLLNLRGLDSSAIFSGNITSPTSIGTIVGSTTYEDVTKEIYIGDSIRKTAFRVNQRVASFMPIGAINANSISGARDFRIYATGLGTGTASTEGSILEYDGVNLNLLPKGYGRITIGSDIVGNTGMTATQAKLVISNTASSIILAKAYSATANQGGMLCLGKSRGTTAGTETTTTNGDGLGYIAFEGVGSGNAPVIGATITSIQIGTAGASFVPADLVFTTTNGTSQQEVMRVTQDRRVNFTTNEIRVKPTFTSSLVADTWYNVCESPAAQPDDTILVNLACFISAGNNHSALIAISKNAGFYKGATTLAASSSILVPTYTFRISAGYLQISFNATNLPANFNTHTIARFS